MFVRRLASKRSLAIASAAIGAAALATTSTKTEVQNDTLHPLITEAPAPPSRAELLKNLESTPKFDVLVIGGGASGAGSALDAASRGLNVALVEMNDFASGTSSKSTKMAHGGVRYLEKAFWTLSKAQLDLVIEALNERGTMLHIAPHLCTILPIMIPVYQWWQVPYFYVGTKMYDLFAGRQNLKSSYLLFSGSAQSVAPMLDPTGLKAGLVYHDGSFNDSRMNSSLATTAISHGATVLNYMEVTQLIKENGKVVGAKAKDRETGQEYTINATSVVNATGPFSDRILEMDKSADGTPKAASIEATKPRMVVPSAGVHIILPEYYCPSEMGLLDANTADGRVMFFLPWQGKCLAGTTDVPMSSVPYNPTATEADIQDILKELQHYIKFPVRREDVLSAWCGIRPLVRDPRHLPEDFDGSTASTQGLVRNHLLFTSETGLITISGGKWTTYREMAQETIDMVVKNHGFQVKPCQTRTLKLIGAQNFDETFEARLIQQYGLSTELAHHLSYNYGDRAPVICETMKQDPSTHVPVSFGAGAKDSLISYESFKHPFTIAELKYTVKYEYARKATDFLMRRSRLGFLDAKAALQSVDGVVKVMGDELNWNEAKRAEEREDAVNLIKSFGVE